MLWRGKAIETFKHKNSFKKKEENMKINKIYTVVAKKTGPTRVADFRAVFTAERPYLFFGPETTYAVEQ